MAFDKVLLFDHTQLHDIGHPSTKIDIFEQRTTTKTKDQKNKCAAISAKFPV